jgi:hypothetical protein
MTPPGEVVEEWRESDGWELSALEEQDLIGLAPRWELWTLIIALPRWLGIE